MSNDDTGDGSQNAPYKSVAYVLAQHDDDVVIVSALRTAITKVRESDHV